MAQETAQGNIPNYVGDMNSALEVLQTFNPRDPSAKQGEHEQEFLTHLLQVIQHETGPPINPIIRNEHAVRSEASSAFH